LPTACGKEGRIVYENMNDPNYLNLVSVATTETGKKVAYAYYLRKDFVAKSMVIYLDTTGIIEKIFFSSDDHGTVEWRNGSGLVDCHRWESEDQARSQSYLTRRYTTILSNGAVDTEFARVVIIPDILDRLRDADLAEWISDIVHVREYLLPVDDSRFRPAG
jgi:hypothetical protein